MTRNLPVAIVLALGAGSTAHAQSTPSVTVSLVSHKYDDMTVALSAARPQISADGYTIAYGSASAGLVAPRLDDNPYPNVYVYDLPCHNTEIVSRSWDDQAGNDSSAGGVDPRVSLSGDGRWVAFVSEATNLVSSGPLDPPNTADVFLVDRNKAYHDTGRVRRVSLAPGSVAPNGASYNPSVSADGRYVAFTSLASNLVPNDNIRGDVFVYSIASGQIAKWTYSVNPGINNGATSFDNDQPSISADGSKVLFRSSSNDLISEWFSVFTGPHAFATNGNANANVLVDRNNQNQIASSGVQWDPSLAGNGSAAAFVSSAPNLWPSMGNPWHVFVRQFGTQATKLISLNPGSGPGPIYSETPSLNGDGSYVAFRSWKPGWQPGDEWNGIYRRDVDGGAVLLVSPGLYGQPENLSSTNPSISASGSRISFESTSTNLVANQTGGAGVYLAHIGLPNVRRCLK